MQASRSLSHPIVNSVRQQLLERVERLLLSIRRDTELLNELRQIRELLESAPLDTGEHSAAASRLRSARRYLVSQERGAARYELNQLAGDLRRPRG